MTCFWLFDLTVEMNIPKNSAAKQKQNKTKSIQQNTKQTRNKAKQHTAHQNPKSQIPHHYPNENE